MMQNDAYSSVTLVGYNVGEAEQTAVVERKTQ